MSPPVAKLRVLVVDDSPFNRRLIVQRLQASGQIEVIASAANGEAALRAVREHRPDAITLDLEMPGMDGFSFLRVLMAMRRTPVIVVSGRARPEEVFLALDLGAVDFVVKPEGDLDAVPTATLDLLAEKLLSLRAGGLETVHPRTLVEVGQVVAPAPTPRAPRLPAPSWSDAEPGPARGRLSMHDAALPSEPPSSSRRTLSAWPPPSERVAAHQPRPAVRQPEAAAAGGRGAVSPATRGHGAGSAAMGRGQVPARQVGLRRLVAVASSTGGPSALGRLFARLPSEGSYAVVVAQHMPPRFTRSLAERLHRLGTLRVSEAVDQDLVLPGTAFLCPGGRCLEVEAGPEGVRVRVVAPRDADRYRPSADRLFESVAAVAGTASAAVVLTGMGDDGTRGAAAILRAGGTVIAESEESAVIYGMPRAVAQAGRTSMVLPIEGIADQIRRMVSMDARSEA